MGDVNTEQKSLKDLLMGDSFSLDMLRGKLMDGSVPVNKSDYDGAMDEQNYWDDYEGL